MITHDLLLRARENHGSVGSPRVFFPHLHPHPPKPIPTLIGMGSIWLIMLMALNAFTQYTMHY